VFLNNHQLQVKAEEVEEAEAEAEEVEVEVEEEVGIQNNLYQLGYILVLYY
jgi:hypothetical protein